MQTSAPTAQPLPAAPRRRPPANPFQRAEPAGEPRLKLLLWGPTGTLKTRTALQFPAPAVIDLERGTDWYRAEFQFHVMPPGTPDELLAAVRYLRDADHEFRTLVVDPITLYWQALQRKWSDIFLSRLQGRKSHHFEFYELSPREWNTIKAEWGEFVRTCLQCDMNIVFVAHDKGAYESTGGGDQFRRVGEMPDAEKNLERVFDMVLRCERVETPKGTQHFAAVIKNRTSHQMPARFPLSYGAIAEACGLENLARKAAPRSTVSAEEADAIASMVAELQIPEHVILDRLAAYGAGSISDLSTQQAKTIRARLEAALAAKSAASVAADTATNGSPPKGA